jgi:hypothetical protein
MDMQTGKAVRMVKFYPDSVRGECKACKGFYDMNSLRARKDHHNQYHMVCADMTRCHSAMTVVEVVVGLLPAHAEGCGCRACNIQGLL